MVERLGSARQQNKVIFEREKKWDKLKKEFFECNVFGKCISIFKGGRRKELQQKIDSIDNQISNIKRWFSSIMREYKFDSVQAFYKELNVVKNEYLDYQVSRVEWEKIYGGQIRG